MPVVVGAIAANAEIYSIGMRAPLGEIQAKWDHAIANPIEPRLVNEAVCHEVVIEGPALKAKATVSTGCRSRSRRPGSTARRL